MGNSRNKKDRFPGVELGIFEHRITKVEAKNDFTLIVYFDGGVIKHFNCNLLLDISPVFRSLKDNPALFEKAHASAGGIIWTDEIDISSEYIWNHGTILETAFSGLIGMIEATSRWGLNESTIRKAIANGRLEENVDYKKMGRQYILTEAAVKRLYGPELSEIRPGELAYPEVVMKRYYSKL